MLQIKKTTLKDIRNLKKDKSNTLKDLRNLQKEADDLKRRTYLEKFGKIKSHILDEELVDREIDDFY